MKLNIVKTVMTIGLIIPLALLGGDESLKEQKRPVYALDNSGWPVSPPIFTPVLGDWSRLTRHPDQIRVEARLSGLDPGQVYNAHLWIWNNPLACQGSPGARAIGAACAQLVDQFIPETMPSLVSFGGFIPDGSGHLVLDLVLRISEGFPAVNFFQSNGLFTSIVVPPGGVSLGLLFPRVAEVGFDLARKGALQPGNTQIQFKTMFGGCGPDFVPPPLDPDQLCEVVRESAVGGLLQ